MKLWNRLFLEHRSSLGISFFRIFVALTVGFHVIPSFLCLEDNYLSTAFKEVNLSFFTPNVIEWVQQSPDWLVYFFVAFFCLFWFSFLVGLYSQISCILLMLACYYFYALNSFHIGTLSWDILLVTLFLMCVSGYHGDYFSLDCLRRGNIFAYKKKSPFFIQRLLQFQIASNYFYTALYKVTAHGNWLTDNPMYYLYNYPKEGVTKQFPLRQFFAQQPELCYWLGISVICMELTLPFLLFIPRTRLFAIGIGFLFHILLLTALHVPTIFFFLFPPQFLLFIHPDTVLKWIKQRRVKNRLSNQAQLIYDGQCGFCRWCIQKLLIMDLFGYLRKVDYQRSPNIEELHPSLNQYLCHSQLHLIEPSGKLYGGFFIFRRLCLKLPMLYPFIPIFYFPGSGFMGPWVYRWVAKNRYLFHFSRVCKDNACFVRSTTETLRESKDF